MAEPCLLRLNNGEQSKANCWHCWFWQMQGGSSKGNFIRRAILLLPHSHIFRASTDGFFKVLIGIRLATITKATTHKRQLAELLRAVKVCPKLCKDSAVSWTQFTFYEIHHYIVLQSTFVTLSRVSACSPDKEWSEQSYRVLLAKYDALKNMGGGDNTTSPSSQAWLAVGLCTCCYAVCKQTLLLLEGWSDATGVDRNPSADF